ncbi:serine/threonine protein phosphatase [Caulobacter endophyticus]|uniref:Serine/threonine protein phosphatase n=1 Tax=Caulobacter endophyticus TaxID=2172652 RepID=A0A2T9JXB1_9CAUL|nr:serine/threonine protein phosphatase [Caulobacter endophyticus]
MKTVWRRLVGGLRGASAPSPVTDADWRPSAPGGEVVYAIGDVHGRADLLGSMVSAIWHDIDSHGIRKPVIVPLGDYIDRGPETRRVLQILLAIRDSGEVEFRPLMGNHEQIMLGFLSDDPMVGAKWVRFGGAETLRAYGVPPPSPSVQDPDIWRRTQAAFIKALPQRHLAFLEALEICHERGDYFFAHAGVRPGVRLADQDETDLLWIRAPFLQEAKELEKIVVHGHTPEEIPMFKDCRIGLDTGAYATGRLTAIRLEGTTRRILQARARPSGPPEIAWYEEGEVG